MKTIYKICTISGLAAVLATTTVHASFDESMYAVNQSVQLFSDDNGHSGYYEPVVPRRIVNSPNDPGYAIPKGGIGALVPEPTTIIAGALLLLPFGVSTMRILRQRKLK